MTTQFSLPDIPEKRYFTIGEASDLCQVKPHVLRYWEQEFSQLKPVKRRGNRRYYQRKDIELVRQIRELLYANGYTINGARKALTHHRSGATQDSSAQPVEKVVMVEKPVEVIVEKLIEVPVAVSSNAVDKSLISELRAELEVLLSDIKVA